MLLKRIREDKKLKPFIRKECCENNISVGFDDKINSEDCVIIKVDDFYNSWNVEKRPPSPDCLILLKCQKEGYALAIVELKDVSTGQSFKVKNMIKKFETCLYDFMSTRFKEYFDIDYERIKLYFVNQIPMYSDKRHLHTRGLQLETLIEKRFKFKNKSCWIEHYNPTPLIKACY